MELKLLGVFIPLKESPWPHKRQLTRKQLDSGDVSPEANPPEDPVSALEIKPFGRAPIPNMMPIDLPMVPVVENAPKDAYPTSDVGPLQLATASEAGVEDQPTPNTVSTIATFKFDPSSSFEAYRVVGLCTSRMARERRPASAREQQIVFNILKAFDSIGSFNAGVVDSLNIRNILLNVLGESSNAGKYGPFEYPEPLQRNASIILNRLDEEIAAEETPEQLDMLSESLPHEVKRRRTSESQTRATGVSRMSLNNPLIKDAMRGIYIGGAKRRTYNLDREYRPAPRECNVRGHNGLEVGDWWPLRVCALRDGAHGALIAGIAGNTQLGAYSIVISNEYADLDRDLGDVIYYSGSNSHTNTDPNTPQISHGTKSMRVSCVRWHPVRVIRSGKAGGRYAPSKGLRYDGLYVIQHERQETNKLGGAYLRFKLVRCENQPPIDVNRPTRREREIFERVTEA